MTRSSHWLVPDARVALAFCATLILAAGCTQKQTAPGEVAIEVTDAGFVPAVVTVPKGQPATLVVTRKIEQTCATSMVFAANGEAHELPLNQTVRVELPAERSDTLDYACPMNMITGKVVSK